jgi:catechol 2,3-dioxygenase-like lactoylglutathione lyase family enzyme
MAAMSEPGRPKLMGINHVALEVGDVDEALAFYARLFAFELRGRAPGMAFVDMGDQFLALAEPRHAPPDRERHIGLVVDDREVARAAVAAAGLDAGEPGGHLRFDDPWGNAIEVVDYREVQFSKTAGALRVLGLEGIRKTPAALAEFQDRGLG